MVDCFSDTDKSWILIAAKLFVVSYGFAAMLLIYVAIKVAVIDYCRSDYDREKERK